MSAPPPPSGGWNSWPAPPPPPRSRALLGVLLGLLGAILLVTAIGAALLLLRESDGSVATPPPASTLTAAPATPPGTRTPTPLPSGTERASTEPSAEPRPSTPRPKPTPSASETTEPPTTGETVLVRNRFYGERMASTGCAQPPRPLPTSRSADERYLKRIIDCLAAAYRGPLEAAGFKLTRPDLMVYTGAVQTPCGQGRKGYPVFYCPSNETIYSSSGSTADYGENIRLGGYWIAFHEYGHHVQHRIGVLNAAYARDEEQLQISRRIELQADCMMAMTGIAVRTTELNDQDREEMVRWRKAAADDIHGRTASQLYWIDRGFDTNSFRRCSTWTATNHIG